jgi:hypothetical protein
MSRPDLDRMLEKAVAEAIGVPHRSKPVKRAYKPRSPASYHPVHPQPMARDLARELQHA